MGNENSLRLNGRIWIETDQGRLLGHGRVELMERIGESGSIRQAALQMKMSYRQSCDYVKVLNEGFDEPVIVSVRGGKGGGNASLTEKGLQVIKRFHALNVLFQAFLKEQEQQIGL